MKQKTYLWNGIDQHGMRISGKKHAENIECIKNELMKQHISPLKIHKKFQLHKNKKISSKHIVDNNF